VRNVAKAKKPVVATDHDVRVALRLRYPQPAWATFEEVGSGVGFGNLRHIDLLAIGTWPSRGHEVIGVEIKVSRQDFLRELKNPAKAEPIQKYCDRWYIAAGSADIVKKDELPSTWGLLVLKGAKMACVKEAPLLEATPMSKKFVCAVLRRAAETQKLLVDRARQDGVAQAGARSVDEAEVQRRCASLKYNYDKLHERVCLFEERSGVKIDHWALGKVADTVKLMVDPGAVTRIRNHESEMSELIRQFERALEGMKITRQRHADAATQLESHRQEGHS
jgi:hypothetical protein